MIRNRFDFIPKLTALLSKQVKPFFYCDSFYILAIDIFDCLEILDESFSYKMPLKGAIYQDSKAYIRKNNLNISTDAIGIYHIIVDPPIHHESEPTLSSPHITAGATKIYKRGGIEFYLFQNQVAVGSLEIRDLRPVLKLSKRSHAHRALLSPNSSLHSAQSPISADTLPFASPVSAAGQSVTSPDFGFSFAASPHHGPTAFQDSIDSKKFLDEGFLPGSSFVFPKQNKNRDEVIPKIYTEDFGISITNPHFAPQITQADFPLIARAILDAGKLNPPLFVPYDFKPEHILVQIVNGQKIFHVIDFVGPQVTPPYISELTAQYIGYRKNFAYFCFDEAKNNIEHPNPHEFFSYKTDKDAPSREEKIMAIVADTIVSTFVTISSYNELSKYSLIQLDEQPIISSLVLSALSKLQELPNLFRSHNSILAGMIANSLHQAELKQREIVHNPARHIKDPWNWRDVFFTTYKNSLWDLDEYYRQKYGED